MRRAVESGNRMPDLNLHIACRELEELDTDDSALFHGSIERY